MTNREWLNSLSDEALADLLNDCGCDCCVGTRLNCYGNCRNGFVEWLKKEHEDDKNKCLKCLCYTCRQRKAKCKNICKDCVDGMWCITKQCSERKEGDGNGRG